MELCLQKMPELRQPKLASVGCAGFQWQGGPMGRPGLDRCTAVGGWGHPLEE